MELFINISPFICGVFWVIFSFVVKTKNIESTLLFKVIPFTTGMINIFVGCKLMGWI